MTFPASLLLAVAGVLALAGCGSQPPSTSTTMPQAPITKPATADGGDDCAEVVPAVKAAIGMLTGITDVEVVGQCTSVVVSTDYLADADGADMAKGVCDKAGVEAYGIGAGSVSVKAADGTELAIGIKGAPCLAQPR